MSPYDQVTCPTIEAQSQSYETLRSLPPNNSLPPECGTSPGVPKTCSDITYPPSAYIPASSAPPSGSSPVPASSTGRQNEQAAVQIVQSAIQMTLGLLDVNTTSPPENPGHHTTPGGLPLPVSSPTVNRDAGANRIKYAPYGFWIIISIIGTTVHFLGPKS